MAALASQLVGVKLPVHVTLHNQKAAASPKRVQQTSIVVRASNPASSPARKIASVAKAVPAAALSLATAGSALAADVVSQTAFAEAAATDGSSAAFAVASGGVIAALAAALAIADPQKRREKQVEEVGGDEKDAVRKYFNTAGFERWRKIYGETDEVNSVQLDIRQGHAQTVEKVLNWLKASGRFEGITICDAGCGTGSLSIPMALEGAKVYASDISSAMVGEAAEKAKVAIEAAGKGIQPTFEAKDLESISGKYDTVICLDVLIHYPQDKSDAMISHLASLAENRVILSFAPYTPYYAFLKRIGELFPGPSKATRAYLHAEEEVEKALKAAGWKVTNREMTATKFYFSRLLEAVRA